MNAGSPGLRERKKQLTRDAIQRHALQLYLEQGYAQTTTAQIAAAADVSPSTFFRYFPTKSDTVLYDRLDPALLDGIQRQPPDVHPLRVVRLAMRELLDGLPPEELALQATRWRLIGEVPELRAAAALHLDTSVPLFAAAVAQRVGREPDDPDLLSWVGGVLGASIVSLMTAFRAGADPVAAVERALERLEDGMPL